MATDMINYNLQENNKTLPNIVDNIGGEISQQAKSVHTQPIRNIITTIQVEDEKGNILQTISGKATGGSITVSADSLIRRTGDLTMVVDPDLMPDKNSVVWYGKYFKLYQGIVDLSSPSQEPVNFLLGTFLVDETTLSVAADNSSIQIKLSDKMTQYDSDGANSTLENQLVIPTGTSISVAIRMMMELVGETSFGQIDESQEDEVMTYDYTKEIGTNIIDIIKELRDYYMDYICGYNIKGEFEFKRIEIQKETDQIEPRWDFDSTQSDRADLTISFSESYNLRDIKNRVIIYGSTSTKTGYTPMGEVKIVDAKNPFNIDAVGQRTKVDTDSNLTNDIQCIAKARYEIWQTAHFQEKATITSIPIYVLDANDIITITNPTTKEKYRYSIDSISLNLGVEGEMSITAHKLYYVGLDYGTADIPVVTALKKGIQQLGWLSLGEQRIKDCYGISGSGNNIIMIRFVSNGAGGEQAAVQGYYTTKTQTLELDISDFESLNFQSESGDTGRSSGDYADRVLAHEMTHAVMNDYYGVTETAIMPTWFKEGMAELTHGAKERYRSLTGFTNATAKKKHLMDKCKDLLDGKWTSTSEDYVAAYLLCAGMYYLSGSKEEFQKVFMRLKDQSNVNLNFLFKAMPLANSNDEMNTKLLGQVNSMTLWNDLEDITNVDTGSIGGSSMMNIENRALNAEDVFNNEKATTDSIGFKLQYDE